MPWTDLLRVVLTTMVLGAPLALSVWALLDAARRPRWAWALADRNQVAWMTTILAGILFVCAGLAISGWYLLRVRPVIAAAEAGREAPTIAASRWTVRADSPDEAWLALGAWRGLRAPGRLEAVDPADLRERADDLDRDEVLASYSIVSTPDDYVETYRPLITEVGADVVTLQTTSLDQESTIAMLGRDVLPELRLLGS